MEQKNKIITRNLLFLAWLLILSYIILKPAYYCPCNPLSKLNCPINSPGSLFFVFYSICLFSAGVALFILITRVIELKEKVLNTIIFVIAMLFLLAILGFFGNGFICAISEF
jgi:hypothetical protein